ncbi:hypothetical protein N4R57_18830 [Rhodobacteraceae bacterium D3-12]|nr:hypothetical protein N4R57_18830 [Rhodobacteraceae bacterium D3-12]
MTKPVLTAVALFNLAMAVFIFLWPMWFYEAVPGVAQTGAFNSHFLRDVALAYLVSGAALWVAAAQGVRALGVFGAAWPVLHALFHIWIWAAMRGAAVDLVALANLFGIQLPAWAALIAALHLGEQEAGR